MHGWISLPIYWYWVFLFLAPAIGIASGLLSRAKHQILLWLLLSCGYSIFVVLFAFGYEYQPYQGGYNMGAWFLVLGIPVLIFALPAIGIPWAISRVLCSLRKRASSSRI